MTRSTPSQPNLLETTKNAGSLEKAEVKHDEVAHSPRKPRRGGNTSALPAVLAGSLLQPGFCLSGSAGHGHVGRGEAQVRLGWVHHLQVPVLVQHPDLLHQQRAWSALLSTGI